MNGIRSSVEGIASRAGVSGRLPDLVEHLRTPIYRDAYALVVNSAMNAGLGVVYWVLVARLYPATDVGRNSAVISALVFLSGISQLNLRVVLSRFIPVAGDATRRLVWGSYLVTIATSIGVAAAFILGAGLWTKDDVFETVRSDTVSALLFVVLNVMWCIFALQDGVLIGLRQAVWVAVENSLFGIGKIVLAIAFAIAVSVRPVGIVASWVVPMALAIVFVNVFVFRRFIPEHVAARPERHEIIEPRRIARFVGGDYVGSLFAQAYVSLLPVVVIAQTGAVAAAHFYIVWVIATSLQLIPTQMLVSLVVETAADPASFAHQARRMVMQIARLLVPAGILTFLAAPLVLQIFGGGYAADGTDLLRLLVVSLVPFTAVNLYFGYARVRARVSGIVVVQAILAASILGFSVLLLPRIGTIGVGVAYLASQTVVALGLAVTGLRPVLRTFLAGDTR